VKEGHETANNVSENSGLLDHKEEGLRTLRMLGTIHIMTKKHIPEDMNFQNMYTPFQYTFILISLFTYL